MSKLFTTLNIKLTNRANSLSLTLPDSSSKTTMSAHVVHIFSWNSVIRISKIVYLTVCYCLITVKTVLRGHIWDKEKSGLI